MLTYHSSAWKNPDYARESLLLSLCQAADGQCYIDLDDPDFQTVPAIPTALDALLHQALSSSDTEIRELAKKVFLQLGQ